MFETFGSVGWVVFTASVETAELDDVLAAIRAWPPAQVESASPQLRASWLAGLRQVVDAAECAFTETLRVFDAHGDGETLHAARNTAAWVRGAFHLADGDAAERVRLARASDDVLKSSFVELRAGRITFEHARTINRGIRDVDETVKLGVANVLTELSTHTDVGTVRKAAQQVRTMIDPDGALTSRDKEFSRRRLHLSPLLDGMVCIDGILDPEAAATVSAALQPFLVPASPDDQRTPSQRRADGLVDLARLAMEHNKLGELGGTKPRLQVSCDVDTLARLRGALAAELPDAPGQQGLLSRTDLERIACDAAIARVLLGPDCVPTDIGRDQRLFTSGQRNAFAARDGGCRFPNCHFPPALTDAHHITSWLNGGKTSVPNGALLCRYHHRTMHSGRWHIEVTDSGPNANDALTFIGPLGQRMRSEPHKYGNTPHQPWWTKSGTDPPLLT